VGREHQRSGEWFVMIAFVAERAKPVVAVRCPARIIYTAKRGGPLVVNWISVEVDADASGFGDDPVITATVLGKMLTKAVWGVR
jgi:hypothetical protein